jgi:hypothetical protein
MLTVERKKDCRLCKRTSPCMPYWHRIQSGPENAPDFGKGELDGEDLRFRVRRMKCRTRGSRKYCRSRWQPLCHVWPEPGRQFAIHSLGLPFHHYRETCLITSRCTGGYRNAPRDQPLRVDQDQFVPSQAKAAAPCWLVSQKARTLR